ncbi:MAG: 23S rRNA (uracil(1939)-C(5))-methyltransferase RlmD [Clostridia bacterium]|nr:23S rRNA (uracil(1939)-C(5))-methyltransferase RlmD [Clostridia bacterium]
MENHNSRTATKKQNKKTVAAYSKGNGCPYYKKCGGCHLQNMTYAQQLSFKQVKAIKLLGRFCRLNEIIGMENPVHYRCKVQAAFGKDKSGIISGVYQSSTHKIVPIDSCMIEDEKADEIIVTIRKLLKSFKLKPFDEDNMTGFLRHVLVRRGYYTGQIMVVLVTGTPVFPSSRSFVNALLQRHPEITTIVQNVNDKFTSLVLGEKTVTLYGEGYIEDAIDGYVFRISPRSFYQVNPVMTERLYSKAIEYMGLTGKETVIDTYCGTGTIGILASKNAGRVIGVEVNADAVRDAKFNASRNNVKNIDFFTADASDFMVEMAKAGEKAEVVIMDPPRAGSDKRFINAAVTLGPEKIVYVSCNPETLARDLNCFVQNGYKVKRIQPVDMFPHTHHIECACLLIRKDG